MLQKVLKVANYAVAVLVWEIMIFAPIMSKITLAQSAEAYWHLDWHKIIILTDTPSTLNQHSMNISYDTRLTLNQHMVDIWSSINGFLCSDQKLVDSWPTVSSCEVSMECWSSINWVVIPIIWPAPVSLLFFDYLALMVHMNLAS